MNTFGANNFLVFEPILTHAIISYLLMYLSKVKTNTTMTFLVVVLSLLFIILLQQQSKTWRVTITQSSTIIPVERL